MKSYYEQEKTPTQLFLSFIIKQQLELSQYKTHLKSLIKERFSVWAVGESRMQYDGIIETIIAWENDPSPIYSLEKILTFNFVIKVKSSKPLTKKPN